MKWLAMVRHSRRSGIFLPFKIHNKSHIVIRKNVKLTLGGRVELGDPAPLPVVSLNPINLFFDEGAKVHLGKSITIGPGVNIVVKKNAVLNVGDRTIFGWDMHINVVHKLEIGAGCLIALGSTFLDVDHHQVLVDGKKRMDEEKGIVIGDRVWIGVNTTILRGTKIGSGSIVSANSLVQGNFPERSLILGNPARVFQTNVTWE